MKHLQPPTRIPLLQKLVFLAGSIEQGTALHWQQQALEALKDFDVVVANPRRDAWDPTWDQTPENGLFAEQVNWELDHLEQANWVFFYFDPNTKSPISLLELGKVLETHEEDRVIVSCPQGFWRRGNVEICCSRKGVPVHSTLDAALAALTTGLATPKR